MYIDTNTIFSMTQANKNFSQVAKTAEEKGEAIIFMNNKPKFIVIDIEKKGSLLELSEKMRRLILLQKESLKNIFRHLRSWQNNQVQQRKKLLYRQNIDNHSGKLHRQPLANAGGCYCCIKIEIIKIYRFKALKSRERCVIMYL